MSEPSWLNLARADIGERETLGPNNSPWIRTILAKLGQSWLVGQPWCGGAMAHWMTQAGIQPPKAWYRAKAWLTFGVPLTVPVVGAVVVFERAGGGHVGLVVGKDARGRLMVLGGNQSDAVNVAAFDITRVVGYRWPLGVARASVASLPLISTATAAPSSTNEA